MLELSLTSQEQALLKPPVLQLSRDSTGRRFSDGGANIQLFMKNRQKMNGPQLQSQVAQKSSLLATGLNNDEEQVSTVLICILMPR